MVVGRARRIDQPEPGDSPQRLRRPRAHHQPRCRDHRSRGLWLRRIGAAGDRDPSSALATVAKSSKRRRRKRALAGFQVHAAQPAYWTSGNVPYDRALLTHRVKTMFGFDELAEAVDEEAKEKAAYDKLRYMM